MGRFQPRTDKIAVTDAIAPTRAAEAGAQPTHVLIRDGGFPVNR
jgi:hypothetical protein